MNGSDLSNARPAEIANSWSSQQLLSVSNQRLISGNDPTGMQVAAKEIKVPINCKRVDFEINCQLAAVRQGGTAFLNVEFQGKDSGGATKRWKSPWQPTLIKTTENWMQYHLSDSLPDEILRLRDIKACVTVCPFGLEELLVHKKSAIKGKVLVKDIEFVLKPEIRQATDLTATFY
jgi:hypothetical protein